MESKVENVAKLQVTSTCYVYSIPFQCRPCSVSPNPAWISAQSPRTPVDRYGWGLIPAHLLSRIRLHPAWNSTRPKPRRSRPFRRGEKTRLPTRGWNPEQAHGARDSMAAAPPYLRRPPARRSQASRRRSASPSGTFPPFPSTLPGLLRFRPRLGGGSACISSVLPTAEAGLTTPHPAPFSPSPPLSTSSSTLPGLLRF
jgi:hypothetical protein